jgi:hypothetical protein
MPYYVVSEHSGDSPKLHLVNAKNQAQALKAVVEPRFTVRVAEEKELIALTKSGIDVIEAS